MTGQKYSNNTDKPLLAIRCITYNHEPYIRDCLEGFVMQKTNFKFVAIVHDDASTDKTADIIREYEAKYPDIIKPIYETVNQYSKHDGSLGRIMNAAIDATGAKYVAMCEGDDYWTDPYKLQKQVDYLEDHKEVGLCVTDFCFQNEMNDVSKPAFAELGLLKPQTFKEHLVNAGYIGPMTWMYRKDTCNGFNPEKGLTDGTLAIALYFFANSKVAYLLDCTAVYRSHEGSATSQADSKKAFKYEKGVFDTQIGYAYKYNLCESEINNLKFQGYASNIIPALEADDVDFVQESLDFYHSQGVEMKWFVEKCKQYVGFHRQYEQISHSKAYRLGKLLLKPLKIFKKK